MRLYDELERAEQVKIGQRVKIKITVWNDELVPESVAVYDDKHVGGNRSVRIYRLPKNHKFRVFDEIFGTVEYFSVAPEPARDGRKKVYIYLREPRRVYSFHTSHWNDELTVTIQCGNNTLNTKKFPYPHAEVTDIDYAPTIEIGTEIRMLISESGAPRPKLIGHDWNEVQYRSIRIYQLPDDHHFKKGEVIKATIDSVSVGHGLAMGKRKKVFIALREPRRVYTYRLDTAENNLIIQRYCGERFIKTKKIPIIKEEFEAIHNDTIYRVIKKTFKNGRAFRTTYIYAGSVEGRVKESFANLRSLLGNKIGPERMKKIRTTIRNLPQLESEPLIHGTQYDYLAEREAKRQRTRDKVGSSGQNKSPQLSP